MIDYGLWWLNLENETKKVFEKDLAVLLKSVADRANWCRIGRRSDWLDVFSHKIKAAAHQPSIPRFVDRLCYSLGVQSPTDAVTAELIRRLDSQGTEVLKALRKETIYYMLTSLEVKK